MSERFTIDLDNETIDIDGESLTRADLSQRITERIAAGDFKVGRLAGALEHLDETLAGAATISFKVTADTFNKLEAASVMLGQSPAQYARDIIVQLLGEPVAPVPRTTVKDVGPVASGNAGAVSAPAEDDALVLTPKKKNGGAKPAPEILPESGEGEVVLDLGPAKKA